MGTTWKEIADLAREAITERLKDKSKGYTFSSRTGLFGGRGNTQIVEREDLTSLLRVAVEAEDRA